MTQSIYQVVTLVGTLLAAFGAICGWQFVIQYSQVDWRRYEAGRHLMSFTKGLSIILTYVVVVAMLAQWFTPMFQPINVLMARDTPAGLFMAFSRLAIFGWLAWQLWHRLRMLERYQNGLEGDREDDTRESADAEPQY